MNRACKVFIALWVSALPWAGGKALAQQAPASPSLQAQLSLGSSRFDFHSARGFQIAYRIPTEREVVLTVYNAQGEAVRSLADKRLVSGSYTAIWDGKDGNGAWVRTGRYRIVLEGRNLFEFQEVAVTIPREKG